MSSISYTVAALFTVAVATAARRADQLPPRSRGVVLPPLVGAGGDQNGESWYLLRVHDRDARRHPRRRGSLRPDRQRRVVAPEPPR